MANHSRADITSFLKAQQDFVEEYTELLARALALSQQATEAEVDTVLDSEAGRALQLLQHQQRQWQSCVDPQVTMAPATQENSAA